MASRAQIVILNGVGSVGKSSTAKALQAITSKPFLHVAMDAFLDMLPEAMLSHPEGLMFEASGDNGKPIITVRSGADPGAGHARDAACDCCSGRPRQ